MFFTTRIQQNHPQAAVNLFIEKGEKKKKTKIPCLTLSYQTPHEASTNLVMSGIRKSYFEGKFLQFLPCASQEDS